MNKSKRNGLIAIGLAALIIMGSFNWYMGKRNVFITQEESLNAAWAEIDNQLQRRLDLIPNLVATVKGYAAHESEVFTGIADARSKLAGAGSVEEKAEGYGELQGALSRLLVVVESYPQLQANANFIRLQDELAGTENRLTVARKRYNDEVKIFNTAIRMYPGSIIAGSLGMEKRSYFEIPDEARSAPAVSFD